MDPSFTRELRSCQLCGKGWGRFPEGPTFSNPCMVLAGNCGFLHVIPDTWAALESAHAHTHCTQTSRCVWEREKTNCSLCRREIWKHGPCEDTWEQDNAINLPKKWEAEEDGTTNPPRKEIKQEQAVDNNKKDFGLNFCAIGTAKLTPIGCRCSLVT